MAVCAAVMVCAAVATADEKQKDEITFRSARRLLLKGEYDKAAEAYETLSKQPDHRIRAACGRARVDLEVGAYAAGLERLKRLASSGESSADWHAHIAALHEAVGDYQQAIKHNQRAIELDENHYLAHWQLGQLMETIGRPDQAVEAYTLFELILTGGKLPTAAEDSVILGRGFYRYSVLERHANLVDRIQHVLDEFFDGTVSFVDADYWPARLAAGELRLERHWLRDARDEFEAILRQNPNAADAMVGIGRALLEEWDFEGVEKQAESALAVNPSHLGAILLLANTRMTERRFADAAALAERALAVNPSSIDALAALAGARRRGLGLKDGKQAIRDLQARAEAISRKPAAFHLALGRWLSQGRQFAEAEPHFKKAAEYAPWWPAPLTALGQLYMEIGEEKFARKALDAAFALDSFDHQTFNVLGLLDQLQGFARLESEHFVVKYDEKDAVIAPYFRDALESAYEEVCEDFESRPEKQTIIEVFPDHDGFSVRIAGRPFIATVGACTGRVIAMTAPRGRPPFGRFNWASVLRHEFTHTVSLAATKNRIPHWFTEGLAVYEEISPRSWDWKQLLGEAVRRDRLFSLDEIDWGFMRPRRMGDRELAYAQSEWMVEFIIERYRYESVLKLLKAFRDGLQQPDAFAGVLKTEPAAFDRDFAAWARAQVEKWGLPATQVEDPAEIHKAIDADPENAALHARLAQAELLDGRFEEAEQAARKALAIDDRQPLALEVISRLFVGKMLAEKDEDARRELMKQAEPFIRSLHRAAPENPLAVKYLAYLEQAWEHWNDAIGWYREYQARFPEDPDSYRRLAAIYLRRKQIDPALKQMESLFRLAEDEPAVARQIAAIQADRGEHDRAAHWLVAALHVDPYDIETHGALADAYLALKEYPKAEREYKVVTRLLPDDAIGYEGLSQIHAALGNPQKAEAYQRKAEALRGKDDGDNEAVQVD